MTDRLIRITTALAVVAVAVVAAIISYQHAYELVRSHGESSVTARLLPFTVDGLIWAASMVVLDASRRNRPAPRLAAWSLGAGIVATVGANLAHGVGHGPVGALVSAWPALALVGSLELLMMRIRTGRGTRADEAEPGLGTTLHHHWHRRTTGPQGCANPGTDSPRTARAGHEAARDSARTRHRPPQGQAHPRPSGVTNLERVGEYHLAVSTSLGWLAPWPCRKGLPVRLACPSCAWQDDVLSMLNKGTRLRRPGCYSGIAIRINSRLQRVDYLRDAMKPCA